MSRDNKSIKLKNLIVKNMNHLNTAKSRSVMFELNEEELFVGSPYCYDLKAQQKELVDKKGEELPGALLKRFGI